MEEQSILSKWVDWKKQDWNKYISINRKKESIKKKMVNRNDV